MEDSTEIFTKWSEAAKALSNLSKEILERSGLGLDEKVNGVERVEICK